MPAGSISHTVAGPITPSSTLLPCFLVDEEAEEAEEDADDDEDSDEDSESEKRSRSSQTEGSGDDKDSSALWKIPSPDEIIQDIQQ